jgi:hypothetical protein
MCRANVCLSLKSFWAQPYLSQSLPTHSLAPGPVSHLRQLPASSRTCVNVSLLSGHSTCDQLYLTTIFQVLAALGLDLWHPLDPDRTQLEETGRSGSRNLEG